MLKSSQSRRKKKRQRRLAPHGASLGPFVAVSAVQSENRHRRQNPLISAQNYWPVCQTTPSCVENCPPTPHCGCLEPFLHLSKSSTVLVASFSIEVFQLWVVRTQCKKLGNKTMLFYANVVVACLVSPSTRAQTQLRSRSLHNLSRWASGPQASPTSAKRQSRYARRNVGTETGTTPGSLGIHPPGDCGACIRRVVLSLECTRPCGKACGSLSARSLHHLVQRHLLWDLNIRSCTGICGFILLS
jgi:hypothetical protein